LRLGRHRLILLSLILLLLAGGVGVLVTESQSEWYRRRYQIPPLLNEKINERSQTLQQLQSDWIDDRDEVFAAFQAINEIFSVARSPAGVDQAQTRWPTVQKLMDAARRASLRMPNLTGRAVLEATLARAEIDELRSITTRDTTLRRLAALDHAVALLVETDRVYSKINRRITNAMPAYEDLVGVTDVFLRDHRQGRFGNNEVASDFYALQTQRFVQPINQIRADLKALDEEAAQAASLTVEAFEEWNRLRRAD
jgi:hypothetical protein